MALGETVPIEPVGDDDLPCDGELCRDQANCVCGLRLRRLHEAGAGTVEAAPSQEAEQPGIEIYDREEALRQIDLLGGADPHSARRLSEADDSRLARLRDVVEYTPRRALLLPEREWHFSLGNLREDCPPFAAVTGLIERAVALAIMSRTPLRLPPILLAGPPGVGKTHYCRALAEALATSAHRIACNTNADAKQLFTGLPSSWKGARMGVMTEALLLSAIASPLFILDEIDKFQTHDSETPYAVLLSVLEPENSRALVDEYLRVPFDLSHALFVATANDVARLPSFIVDRFLVFSIAKPAASQLLTIARRIVRDELARHGGTFALPDDAAIARLAHSHPRRITRLVPLALAFAAAAGRSYLTVADIDAAQQITAAEPLTRPIGFMARQDVKSAEAA